MLTLRLNDASEVKVSDAGFTTSVIKLDGIVTNAVTFTTVELPLMNVQSYFKDTAKTTTMSVLNEDQIPVSTMEGYTHLVGIQVDLNGDAETYTITMAQPTDFEALRTTVQEVLVNLGKTKEETVNTVKTMNEGILETEKRVNTTLSEMDTFKSSTTAALDNLNDGLDTATTAIQNTADSVSAIQAQIAPPNPENMDLPTLKTYMVAQSKVNLAAWLADHPLTSSAHKSTPGLYSVTAEKQSLLQAAIMVAQLQKAAGNEEYKISWNETGKECEDDWTLEELTTLALEISAYVYPYVKAQQAKETAIMEAVDAEGVYAVDITYDSVAVVLPA